MRHVGRSVWSFLRTSRRETGLSQLPIPHRVGTLSDQTSKKGQQVITQTRTDEVLAAPPEAAVRPETSPGLLDRLETMIQARIPIRLAAAVGVTWFGLLLLLNGIAAPVADAAPSATTVVLSVLFEVSMLLALGGLLAARKWGLLPSMAMGGLLMGGSVLCWVGGHTGAAILAQFVIGTGMLGVSREAFRRF